MYTHAEPVAICRLSISQLQERHSLDAVQAKTAAAVLQTQITKVRPSMT